jgi:ribosome maturation factor RimP
VIKCELQPRLDQPKWACAHFFSFRGLIGVSCPSPEHDPLERVRAIAERVARSYLLEVFDVQHRREAGGWVLRIYLDRPGAEAAPGAGDAGVSVEDCARVSRDVSAILDVEDVINHAYVLEVSSPGLDRPLRNAADYRRFAGRLAKIVVVEPIDKQNHLEGRLKGLDGETVLLEGHAGRIHRIPLSVISRARLAVEF